MDRAHQVILHILVTKDIANKVFDCIYPWIEKLEYISWAIRASYHRIIQATPVQYVFGIDTIFNLASVVDWRVMTVGKQVQVGIDNLREMLVKSCITTQSAI